MQDSIWFQTISAEQQRALEQSDPLPKTAEVAIVGAGIIGLATAYYVSQAGISNVCIIDRGTAAGEASGANAGGLWFAQQSPELGPVAALAKASSRLYDELAARFEFDCERPGLLELLREGGPLAEADETVALVRGAGFRVEKLGGHEARSLEPDLGVTPPGALYYPDEGHVNPVKLGAALVEHLRSQNVRLCLDTQVNGLSTALKTSRGTVTAGTTVIATGAWTREVTRTLGWQPPIKPMRGTLLALEPLPKTLCHTLIGEHFYYWQLPSGQVVGGGSVDDVGFERGVDPETTARIRAEMSELIPGTAAHPTRCAWSGFRPYSGDLKPVIGPVPGREGMFVAAGHFKKGVMMAPVTGRILAELIVKGRTDLPIDFVSPARFA